MTFLKTQHYLFGSVQFSRGCPFQCEFCDIIVTFGRKPRLKASSQIIAELEAQLSRRVEIIFIVDDNLIGNKQAIKSVLREIAAWQRDHGYPLTFFTEASLDLAEDPELLRLMVEANFTSVFIGIESPNEASLRETKKYQNVRAGNTIIDRVRTVQRAGIDVWCGMIVGFDHDDATIFGSQLAFLQESRILHAMVGMLYAIPKTPLYERLAAEGRLDTADENPFGTNVIPLGMSREQLREGYVQIMRDLYDPGAYFERLDRLFINERLEIRQLSESILAGAPLDRTQGASHEPRALRLYCLANALQSAGSQTACGVSPSNHTIAESAARPGSALCLPDQVRHALPPLHHGLPNERAGSVRGEFILTPTDHQPLPIGT